METNIKINYLILETILRLTGTYKNICDEHEFIDVIIKKAKTGNIQSPFNSNEAIETALSKIEELTGVSKKYWSGQDRIKLGIRCTNDILVFDPSEVIDVIDLQNDSGTLYTKLKDNPLALDHEEYYLVNSGLNRSEIDTDVLIDKAMEIEEMTSLRSLITILLINMEDAELVELIDKANVYKHSKWEPYIKKSDTPTTDGMTYKPAYIELRKGLVQTIIKNLLNLGYIFTFRDLDKEISI